MFGNTSSTTATKVLGVLIGAALGGACTLVWCLCTPQKYEAEALLSVRPDSIFSASAEAAFIRSRSVLNMASDMLKKVSKSQTANASSEKNQQGTKAVVPVEAKPVFTQDQIASLPSSLSVFGDSESRTVSIKVIAEDPLFAAAAANIVCRAAMTARISTGMEYVQTLEYVRAEALQRCANQIGKIEESNLPPSALERKKCLARISDLQKKLSSAQDELVARKKARQTTWKTDQKIKSLTKSLEEERVRLNGLPATQHNAIPLNTDQRAQLKILELHASNAADKWIAEAQKVNEAQVSVRNGGGMGWNTVIATQADAEQVEQISCWSKLLTWFAGIGALLGFVLDILTSGTLFGKICNIKNNA